jgi:hypothetical protein
MYIVDRNKLHQLSPRVLSKPSGSGTPYGLTARLALFFLLQGMSAAAPRRSAAPNKNSGIEPTNVLDRVHPTFGFNALDNGRGSDGAARVCPHCGPTLSERLKPQKHGWFEVDPEFETGV